MKLSELQEKILNTIPLASAIGYQIAEISDLHCLAQAPLHLNKNHKGTAFGGSLYAACTLACYTIGFWEQSKAKVDSRHLVLLDGSIQYHKAVTSDFMIRAYIKEKDWIHQLNRMRKRTPSRLMIHAEVFLPSSSTVRCAFAGEFTFLPAHRT